MQRGSLAVRLFRGLDPACSALSQKSVQRRKGRPFDDAFLGRTPDGGCTGGGWCVVERWHAPAPFAQEFCSHLQSKLDGLGPFFWGFALSLVKGAAQELGGDTELGIRHEDSYR